MNVVAFVVKGVKIIFECACFPKISVCERDERGSLFFVNRILSGLKL